MRINISEMNLSQVYTRSNEILGHNKSNCVKENKKIPYKALNQQLL